MKRTCKKCGVEKDFEEFAKHKQRKFGITHECITCSRDRKEYRTPDKIAEKSDYDKRRYQQRVNLVRKAREENPEKLKLIAYRSNDKKFGRSFNLDIDYFKSELSNPCFYCGHKDSPINGFDRIDNLIGHVHGNVLVCCNLCNMTRGNRYTSDDFKKYIAPGITKMREELNGN